MLTAFDKELLNNIQTHLPLHPRPFAQLAALLHSDEETVISRLQWLKDRGYIRRLGPFFDSASLGYVSTLVALQVDENYMAEVAQAINSYSGVTHNYERQGELNLWFTLLSVSEQEQKQVLAEISCFNGVKKLLSLPAIKKYKVNVEFSL